jgi:hypothetical protein
MSTGQQIPVGYDPSVSGLAGAVGDRVQEADGLAVWEKTGPAVTDWEDVTGGGGGGSAGITDGVTMDGDGSIENPYNALLLSAMSWRMDVLRRIKLIDPTFNSLCWSSDCNNINADFSVGTASGTGAAVLEQATNGGSILTSTGTTNNSAQVVNPRDAITTSPAVRFVSNSRTQKSAVYARAQVVAAANLSGKQCVIACLQDITNDNFLGAHGATSTTNWSMVIGGVGLDLGVAADLNVHDFLLVNDGTNFKAYLDWEQIGAAVAVAGAATAAGFPRWYDSNGTTGANVSHRTFRTAFAVVEP